MRRVTSTDEMAGIIANGIYLDHHWYEQMARHVTGPLAHTPSWRGQRLDNRFGQELAISVYRPVASKPPVVSFGNTRLNLANPLDPSNFLHFRERYDQIVSDLHEDLFPLGIGFFRYCYNEGKIKHLLEQLVHRYRKKVVVTGHSLGGALSQLTALRLPEYVAEVVTFQSPKTIRGEADHFYRTQPFDVPQNLQRRSYHYNVAGDALIQQAGEVDSAGQIIRITFAEGEIGSPEIYHAHTKEVFEGFSATRGSLQGLRPLVERRLHHLDIDDVGHPAGQVQSTESQAIEWARANGLMTLIGAVSVPTRSYRLVAELAGPLLKEVMYTVLWSWNVNDFRADPTTHHRFGLRSLPDLPAAASAVMELLMRDYVPHLRDELNTYVRYTRVRS